jgi:hypothetical protein
MGTAEVFKMKYFFYVNVCVVMSPSGRKSKEGCPKLGALPYVHTIHEQYFKLHEHYYLTYIQMIDFQMSLNSMHTTYPVLLHKPIHYDRHKICDIEIFVVQLTH